MRSRIILLGVLICLGSMAWGQNNTPLEGTISYLSLNKVYVRFPTTDSLHVGDTLRVWQNNQWKKALIIESLSSQSCITNSFIPITLVIGTKISGPEKIKPVIKKANAYELVPYLSTSPRQEKKPKESPNKQQIDSRISVSTNGSRDQNARDFDRLRTTASLDIQHIQDSRLSLESYVTFNHKLGTPINDSTFRNDFKIYALALSFASEKGIIVSFGRKLNNRLANMGAIDGLQVENPFENSLGELLQARDLMCKITASTRS